jgi:hypothetical protein
MRSIAWLVPLAMAAWSAPPPERTRADGPARLRIPTWTENGEALRPADVSANVDGSPVKIVRVTGPEDDLVLLVALDLAGDLSLVDPARQALIEGFRKLPANAYVGLLRAQDGLRVLTDPGPDREPAIAAVESLTISGRAGLLDTVQTATRLGDAILRKADVRVAVFYLTDSNIANYREDFTNPVVNSSDSRDLSRRFSEGLVKEKISQVQAGLAQSQTPLFIVHLDYRNDRLNEAYQTGLLALATASGGSAEFCRTVVDIPAAIQKTLDSIVAHYSIEVELKGKPAKQTAVELGSVGGGLRHRTRFQLRQR